MTIQEYFEALNGQYIEVAGTSARNQCVDNANFYIKYVLHLPIIEYANAKDFPSKAGDKYEYILNTPDGVPQEGDLVIWGEGLYGHIAVFIEGDANRFTSFDENFPIGSPCHTQEHNYTSPKVTGWLRCKNKPQSDTGVAERRDQLWNIILNLCTILNVAADEQATVLTAEIKKLIGLEDVVKDREQKVVEANVKIAKLEEDLKKITAQNETLIADNEQLKKDVGMQEEVIVKQGTNIEVLKKNIEDLKNNIALPILSGWKKFIVNLIARI